MMNRLILLTALALCAPACGDDDPPAQNTAPDPQPDPNPAPNPEPDPEPTPDPSPAPDPDPEPDTPACAEGTLFLLAPTDGQEVDPGADADPIEGGVQIDVRLATALPPATLVTVENLGNNTSVGALTDGSEVTVRGVTLSPGDNPLRAVALTDTCLAVSPQIAVTMGEPELCEADADCSDGQTCGESGQCGACASECQTADDCGGRACLRGCFCEPSAFRFVLIEDDTRNAGGDSPGADVDAVSVLKGAQEIFAGQIEDARVNSPTNIFSDPTELLGPPDADCQVQNFVSLGGADFGGYVIVSFDDQTPIENGDSIKVYEVGALLCGRFDDDPYSVSVSASTDQGDFIELGSGGAGGNTIPVSGL